MKTRSTQEAHKIGSRQGENGEKVGKLEIAGKVRINEKVKKVNLPTENNNIKRYGNAPGYFDSSLKNCNFGPTIYGKQKQTF